MDGIIRTVEKRTHSLLKAHAEDWLDSTQNTMEKAGQYLVPTLIGLLSNKVNSREDARNTIDLFERNHIKLKWAEQPEELLEVFLKGDGAIPEKVNSIYQFILGDQKHLVINQLSSTGDLDEVHIDRVLAFLSGIIAAEILHQIQFESQKGRKFLTLMHDEEERVKIQTPSKLLELITRAKSRERKSESKKEQEGDPDSSDSESPTAPYHPIPRLLMYTALFFISLGVLYWVKSPELESLSPMIQWHPEDREHLPDQKIWHLGANSTITLKDNDPFNDFIENYLNASQKDSVRQFALKRTLVSPQDSLLPDYYKKVLNQLHKLYESQPSPPYHLKVNITPGENAIVSEETVEFLRQQINSTLPFLSQEKSFSFVIQIYKPLEARKTRINPNQDTEVYWTLRIK